MSRRKRRKQTLFDDVFDLVAGLSVILVIFVYTKTNSILFSVVSFITPLMFVALINQVNNIIKDRKLKMSGIREVDRMTGYQFEQFLAVMFKDLGYKVRLTKKTGDFGADLIVYKNGVKTVVQAKRYSKKVGIKAIQEISAAKQHYKADKAMVVTNSYFTKSAVQIAKSNNVELIYRDKLIKMILNRNPNQH